MSKIKKILDMFDINGNNECGGTDKDSIHSYAEIYEQILIRFLEKNGCLLEIGIKHGGSIVLWNELLKNHKIFGIDTQDILHKNIKEYVKDYPKKITLEFRDAYCKETIDRLKSMNPEGFDIIIDDGPHTEESQLECIKLYLELLTNGGILVIEDIQNIDSVDVLVKSIPKSDRFNYEISIFDLREKKNRYDDIILTINKTNKIAIMTNKQKSLGNKKSKIVMISMFKNESKGIRRMLESIYRYIDFYVLQDNGSTDGTPQIVEEFFADKNIPGFVYKVEEGWIGFGWNRDHLLQKTLNTDHGCDWIMKMDCDEYLEVDNDFDWSYFWRDVDAFHVTAQNPGCIYYRAWIWNAKLPWKFQHDHTHEVIYLEDKGQDYTICNLPKSFRMIGTNDGESYTIRTKYISDALKLEETMIREETMLSDLYHFWYIGKSYADCYGGDFYPLKESHSKEFARRAIFYLQEYLNFLQPQGIHETAYFSCCNIGQIYKFLKENDTAIEWFNKAEPYCPARNEHIIYLAETYRDLKLFDKMYEQTQRLVQPDRKLPFPEYYFLINPDYYIDSGIYPLTLHNFAMAMLNKMPSFYGAINLFSKEAKIQGIEIGCLYGETTQYLLDYFPNLQLIGIDPYEDYEDWNYNLSNRDKEIDILAKRVNKYKDRFALLKTTSDKAHPFLANNSFDFVFIDGLHTYDQVLKDCRNYYSKIKSGGILAGHDYYVIEEVRNAVHIFATECGVAIDSIRHTDRDVWYWAKP